GKGSVLIYSTRSAFFFSSRRRHTRFSRDWSSDVCSSDLVAVGAAADLLDVGLGLAQRPPRVADGGLGVDACPVEVLRAAAELRRSEERRVGKECRSRGARGQ